MADGWRTCKQCRGGEVGRGLRRKACSNCRGSGVLPPDHLVPLKAAMEAAREAMPCVDEMAGFAGGQRCLCPFMAAPDYPPPCIPCRCRKYADALRAYHDASRATPTDPPRDAPKEEMP